jgi:outer membrane protein
MKMKLSLLSLACISTCSIFSITPDESKKMVQDMKADIERIVEEVLSKKLKFIDPMSILQKQPDELKDEQEKIKAEYERRMKELNDLKQSYMKKESELKTMETALNENAKEKRKEELVNLYTQMQLKEKSLQEYMQRIYQELEGKLIKKMQAAADELGEQEGYLIVLAGGIVYSKKDLDISDKIFKKMNEQYNQEKKKKSAKPATSAQPTMPAHPTPKAHEAK